MILCLSAMKGSLASLCCRVFSWMLLLHCFKTQKYRNRSKIFSFSVCLWICMTVQKALQKNFKEISSTKKINSTSFSGYLRNSSAWLVFPLRLFCIEINFLVNFFQTGCRLIGELDLFDWSRPSK